MVHVGLVIGQLRRGGAEKQLTLLARGLVSRGQPVSVFCLSGELDPFGEELTKEGIPLFTLSRKGHYELRRVLKLAKLLRSKKVNLLQSFLETGNIYSYLARPLAGKPAFLPSVRNLPWPHRMLKRSLHCRALKAADKIIANCRAVADSFATQYTIPREHFHIIHNGVLVPPSTEPEARRFAREHFRIPLNYFKFAAISYK